MFHCNGSRTLWTPWCRNRTASTHDTSKPWRFKLHKRSLWYDRVKHNFAFEVLRHWLLGVLYASTFCHLCCFSPTFSYLSTFVNMSVTLHFVPVSTVLTLYRDVSVSEAFPLVWLALLAASFLTLEMAMVHSSKVWVNFYHSIQDHTREESSLKTFLTYLFM
jgi:hypothetical protein